MKITSFQGEWRFLSNFWPCEVTLDGMDFPSVEHAYMAAKTTDMNLRSIVQMLPDAAQAKRWGRTIKLRADWDQVKLQIMTDLVRQKFSTSPLKDKLLATGDAELIEGNTWNDRFWGVCNGRGLNHLGRILMDVRAGLESTQSKGAARPGE